MEKNGKVYKQNIRKYNVMDGVVNRKKTQKNILQNECHAPQKTHEFSSLSDTGDYHVFELGRPYRRNELYNDCFLGKSADEEIDVRALLEDKESDHVTAHEEMLSVDEPSHDVLEFVDEDELFDTDPAEHHARFSFLDLPIFKHQSVLHSHHVSSRFVAVAAASIFVLSFVLFVGTALAVKERVEGAGERAVASMRSAMSKLNENDLHALGEDVDVVHQEFVYASEEMNKISSVAKFISRFIPGASKLSSGSHIIEAGKYLTHTVKEFHSIVPAVIDEDNQIVTNDGKTISFLELYRLIADRMSNARYDVAQARQHLDQVYLDDVPEEYRDSFVVMREMLLEINASLRIATESRSAVEDMLGANGPRSYLFLLQNNHEMRATGGFIGSYGIVKINSGRIHKMVVDDIYNPDGQLIDYIVPPLPIQKISANWSMHDSNWFADFPFSAKKAMDFYERTGGPTVDGVIALTPAMMEKFLQITGPIEMKEYDVVLTHENFMRVMQDAIEDRNSYGASKDGVDTEEEFQKNSDDIVKKQPKKILSDLMPIMVERLSSREGPQKISAVVTAISEGLKERHVIMYTSNEQIQEIIEESGWGGSVMRTDRDYLSVVNTNINGFKTDGVVEERITHTAEIDDEGYIVNTVSIKREHTGGHTGYPWWDAVNADYMRVYVPEGSQLISVEGHTREINEERLDYDALGYERDKDVVREESNMHIDEETGTRIYDEYGKTVFANWVYVSPQESATVTYKYRLPFRTDFETDRDGKFGSYAIVFQKQSGSQMSSVQSYINLDDAFSSQWHSHGRDDLAMKNELNIDRYHGVVFRVNE